MTKQGSRDIKYLTTAQFTKHSGRIPLLCKSGDFRPDKINC
nr:MAG TPA: hypothetical protein [Caudoviricetes sp.]